MKKLIKGIIDFRKNSLQEYCIKFSKLAECQKPDALLIACCDSRVVPNVFASSDPGDLLVIRNIGNLIPPYFYKNVEDISVASAIEFSILTLNVSDIIVCGHSECGAMYKFLERKSNNNISFLDKWLSLAELSYDRLKKNSYTCSSNITECNCFSQVNVIQQLENLKTYPLINDRIRQKTLRIHGWWFDLVTADVYYYECNSGKFVIIDEEMAQIIFSKLNNK